MQYGAEADRLKQSGRYFVPVEETDVAGITLVRWKTVGYEAYRAMCPRRRCCSGVVDVFAQQTSIVTVSIGPGLSRTLAECGEVFKSYAETKRGRRNMYCGTTGARRFQP